MDCSEWNMWYIADILCSMLLIFTGALDSEKTLFLRFNNTIVLIAGIYHSIAIEPKDCFGNVAAISQSKLDIEIKKV